MSSYIPNPYERPEPPRCLTCDQFMTEIPTRFGAPAWACHNPGCDECPDEYKIIECSDCGEAYTYGEPCPNCSQGAAVGEPEEGTPVSC